MTGTTSLSSRPLSSGIGPLAAIGISMISVQAGASFAKSLFPIVGSSGATALRVTLAAMILGLLLRPWRGGLPKRDRLVLLIYGGSLGTMNLMFYASLQTIPLGVAVAVEFIGPLGVAVTASRRPADFLWVGLAAAGLLALLPVWRQAHPLNTIGLLLALGAGVCWALYIVFGQRAGAAHGARATAWGMMVATVVALPVGLANAGLALFSPNVLVGAVGVALLSSVVPYSFEMFALARLSSRVFGILMSLEPAVAALFGLFLLHEALTAPQWMAIGVIMVASFGTVLTSRRDQPDFSDPPAADVGEGVVALEGGRGDGPT